jgi:hypothetical protein
MGYIARLSKQAEKSSLDSPKPPQLPQDPMLALEQQQAQVDLVQSMQTRTQGDMASLMARYGTRLALGGNVSASPMQALAR